MIESIIEKYRISRQPIMYLVDKTGRDQCIQSTREEVHMAKAEMMKKFYDMGLFNFKNLNKMERYIMYMRFVELQGIDFVAKTFGLTRERVRQLEERSLSKIKTLK